MALECSIVLVNSVTLENDPRRMIFDTVRSSTSLVTRHPPESGPATRGRVFSTHQRATWDRPAWTTTRPTPTSRY